ncbi:OmpA family protein [Salegentibacter sp. BDJ18]|uniref:OmpA family protein n=1 Tax=Salegentibacter sp. BDJ18 TaxID=2816376 RepID=UPI001AB0088B|nr:OmpA family protein [Salegentibacter sp. BDJ18]MBO2543205.1 OmpA family protein [Salegentibacter sp. BDJ18]
MKGLLILFLIFSGLSLILYSQQDLEGSSDHPMITRYPGAYIAGYEVEKFREYGLATGPVTGYRYIAERDTVSGKLTRITYYLPMSKEELSITEVYQDNLQALEKARINILAKGSHPQSKPQGEVGMGGWIGTALSPNSFGSNSAANLLFKGTSSSGGTFGIVGQIQNPEGNVYIAQYGERHSNELILYHIDIIEEKTAETGKVSANPDFIKKEIEMQGSATIYGINFDSNSSNLKEQSQPVIAEIAKYLEQNPEISLYVVGHTDMDGSPEYNLKLSKERARAVVNELTENYGISISRLTSDGVGFLSPKASNITDEGKALNRRTELVKKLN